MNVIKGSRLLLLLAIAAIFVLELYALSKGFNGTTLTTAVASITAIAGFHVGFGLGKKKE